MKTLSQNKWCACNMFFTTFCQNELRNTKLQFRLLQVTIFIAQILFSVTLSFLNSKSAKIKHFTGKEQLYEIFWGFFLSFYRALFNFAGTNESLVLAKILLFHDTTLQIVTSFLCTASNDTSDWKLHLVLDFFNLLW